MIVECIGDGHGFAESFNGALCVCGQMQMSIIIGEFKMNKDKIAQNAARELILRDVFELNEEDSDGRDDCLYVRSGWLDIILANRLAELAAQLVSNYEDDVRAWDEALDAARAQIEALTQENARLLAAQKENPR